MRIFAPGLFAFLNGGEFLFFFFFFFSLALQGILFRFYRIFDRICGIFFFLVNAWFARGSKDKRGVSLDKFG